MILSFLPAPADQQRPRDRQHQWSLSSLLHPSSKYKQAWEQWRVRVKLLTKNDCSVEEQVRNAMLYISTMVMEHLEVPDSASTNTSFKLQVPGYGQESWTGMFRRVLAESTGGTFLS